MFISLMSAVLVVADTNFSFFAACFDLSVKNHENLPFRIVVFFAEKLKWWSMGTQNIDGKIAQLILYWYFNNNLVVEMNVFT